MSDAQEKKLKQPAKQNKMEFVLMDIVRCWNIPLPMTFTMVFMFFLFYVLSIVDTVFKMTEITTVTAVGLNYITSQLHKWEENALTAYFISGMSLLVFITLIGVTISISKEGSKAANHKRKEMIICGIVTLLIGFFFPLSRALIGISFVQSHSHPDLAIINGANLVCLYLVGWFVLSIQGVDNIASSKMTKLKVNADEWIFLGKVIVSSFFHLNLTDNQVYILLLLVVSLFISLLELYEILTKTKFLEESIQQVFTVTCLLNTIFLSISLFLLILKDDLLRDNFEVLALSLFIFSFFSVKAYRNHKKRVTFLEDHQELTSEDEAVTFMLELINLGSDENHDTFERPFIIDNHMKQCSDVMCFCHIYRHQPLYRLARNRIFMLKFVLWILSNIRKRYPHSVTILSLFFFAQLKNNPSFSQIQFFIQEISKRKVGFEKTYAYYQFKKIIERQVYQKKQKNSLPLETQIKQCEQQEQLKECLGNIVEKMTKKYRLMGHQFVQLEEVTDLADIINENIRTVQKIWREYSKSGSLHTLLDPLFMVYFKNLIPSPFEAKRLKQKMMQKVQTIHSISKKNSLLMMYSDKACVFESIFNNNLGIINNVSKSVNKVFHYERNELLGKDIHEVMPPLMAKGHKQMIYKWLSANTLKLEKKVENGIFLDPTFIPFDCMTISKIISNGGDLRVYKLVVRSSEPDCLVISTNGRIEGIGQGLLEAGIATRQDLHADVGVLADRQLLITLKEEQKKWIQIQRSAIQDSQRSVSPFFDCCISKRNHKLGEISFIVISFLDIRKISVSENMIFQEIFRLNSSNVRGAMSFNNYSNSREASQDSEKSVKNPKESQCDEKSSLLMIQNINKQDEGNIVVYLKEKTCDPDRVTLKFRKLTTSALVLCILLAIGIFIVQDNIFKMSFQSLGNILSTSAMASHRNTIFEILYNNAVMTSTYCDSSQSQEKCHYLIHRNQDIINELYSIYQENIETYFSKTTYLKKLKLSENLIEPVTMSLKNQSISVPAYQLLETSYGWFKKIQFGIENGESISESLNLLVQNYESLKKINHNSISFFHNAGESELIQIIKFYFLLMGVVCILICIFLCVIRLYFGRQRNSKIEILDCYKEINRNTAQAMFIFFSSEYTNFKSHPQLQSEQRHEGISNYAEQSNSHNIFFISLIIIAIPLTFYMIYPVAVTFYPTSTAISVCSALFQSESQILESYFDLKTFYLGYNFSKTQDQLESEILSRLNQTQLEFAGIIQSNLKMFMGLDSAFGEEFNSIIVQNVCNIIGQQHLQEVKICNESENKDILERGVISVLYFLLRNTKNALLEMSRLSDLNKVEYLQGVIFQDMDNFIIFVMKMMVVIENRLNQALMKQIPDKHRLLVISHVTSIITSLIILIIWLLLEKREKKKMSDIYGYVLQLPYPVITKKHLAKRIRTIILAD